MDALTRQPGAATILAMTLSHLFTEHDNLAIETLRHMLLAACKVFNKKQIAELCDEALEKTSITNEARQLWQLLQFVNAPTVHQPPVPEIAEAKQADTILNQLNHFERTCSDEPPENQRAVARFSDGWTRPARRAASRSAVILSPPCSSSPR